MEFSLACRNVSCSRVIGEALTQVIDVTTGFQPATLNIVFGEPGCGKDLFLRLLALLEVPDQGEVAILGEPTRHWTEAQRANARNRNFGFVFEAPFLLPSFNVIENIAMPLFKLTGVTPEEARERTNLVLRFVGLLDAAELFTQELPIWAQLRISLARALVTDPLALFVENLDTRLRNDELASFLELLAAARHTFGCSILVTAASRDLANFSNRALQMIDGRVTRDWNPGGLFS